MKDDDIVSNQSGNRTFQEVIETRLSRRGFLGGGLATATAVSLGGVGALLKAVPASARSNNGKGPHKSLLGFQGIAASEADTVVVPPGYTAEVLIAWGDPVSNGPEFGEDASNSAADQAKQWGMHNDGLVYFPFRGSSAHGLIAQNNEYTDDVLLFPNGTANWNQEKTNKSLNAHGVSIVEIKRDRKTGKFLHPFHRFPRWRFPHHGKDTEWRVVRPSKYGRRITGMTPIKIG